MSRFNTILDRFRADGHRITKARGNILKIFLASSTPLSAVELTSRLAAVNITVNKTTVYREIDFLKKQEIIRELQFGDGKKRFEQWPENHHHHLVCIGCDSIECIELDGCLEAEEKKILRENNFKTINHALEFQGLCAKCR